MEKATTSAKKFVSIFCNNRCENSKSFTLIRMYPNTVDVKVRVCQRSMPQNDPYVSRNKLGQIGCDKHEKDQRRRDPKWAIKVGGCSNWWDGIIWRWTGRRRCGMIRCCDFLENFIGKHWCQDPLKIQFKWFWRIQSIQQQFKILWLRVNLN